MKKLLVIMISLVMILGLCSCSSGSSPAEPAEPAAPEQTQPGESADKPVVLRLGSDVASTTPTIEVAQKWADDVYEKSNGSIKIEIFADSQLGTGPQEIEGVRLGSQDIYLNGLSMFSDYDGLEVLKSWNYPTLYKSNDHVRAMMETEYGQGCYENFEKLYNLHVIADDWCRTPGCWLTNTPLKTPEDWKGKKFRVVEMRLQSTVYKYLGVEATPIAWADTYSALQQGIVEGVDGPPTLMFPMSFQECTSILTMSRHFYNLVGPVINMDVWNSLSENQRNILTECAENLAQFDQELNFGKEEQQIKELADKGFTVVEMTPEEARALYAPLFTDECIELFEGGTDPMWPEGLIQKALEIGEQF